MGVDTQESNGQSALNDLHLVLIEVQKSGLPNFHEISQLRGIMRECRVKNNDCFDCTPSVFPMAVITYTPLHGSRLTIDESELMILPVFD
jgi:hypothetical protein